ncbi:MAG: polysaccharide deacetylase family protein [candidate division WOR-3 bacterium]
MKSVLLYHNISKTFSPYGGVVFPWEFRKQIRFLKNKRIKFLTPENFIKEDSGILLTFDDGYIDLYEFAFPIIQEEKIPAIIFVVSGFAGKKNNWDVTIGKSFIHLPWSKIDEMHRYGITIGSHSHLHPDYSRIPIEFVRKDMEISFKIISDKLGEEVKYFSYPFGRIRKGEWYLAEEVGFKLAFTSIPVSLGNPYFLGRWGVYTIDNIFTLSAKLGLNKLRTIEKIKCRGINLVSNATSIIKGFKS